MSSSQTLATRTRIRNLLLVFTKTTTRTTHALWVLCEVGPLSTRSKDFLLKVTLKAPARPAIFFLFPRTRHPALLGGSFAEELLELPVLPGQTGTLLPEKWGPLKAACFPKQMPHKNNRAALTRHPHPVQKKLQRLLHH